jgi:hypothetical protein
MIHSPRGGARLPVIGLVWIGLACLCLVSALSISREDPKIALFLQVVSHSCDDQVSYSRSSKIARITLVVLREASLLRIMLRIGLRRCEQSLP